MVEPQPLGFNNVMFCFICLGIGISLSIIKAIVEFVMKKMENQKKWATSTGEEREREVQRVRGGDRVGEEGGERGNMN